MLGDPKWRVRIASVSKLLVGYAALVALEEESIALDDAAGPTGATVGDLLAHTSGLAFNSSRVVARPRHRRIYSNTGIETFADHLAAQTDMSFSEYLSLGVLEPLGMATTELHGSPAHNVMSSVGDLMRLLAELRRPTLISAATMATASRPHHGELSGVLPGIGRMDPNPFGLTFEIKGMKDPHWTGAHNAPETFGHFGGSGTFLWVDPVADVACVALTDRDFGPWALEVWPVFSDAVLTA